MNKKIETRLQILLHKPQYFEDGMISIHTPCFRDKEAYKKAKEISIKETNFKGNIDWRLHTALWSAKICSKIDGDFIECGVNTGYLMRAIANYVDFNKLNKKMYLLDTFEGIPKELMTKEELEVSNHTNPKYYEGTYEAIKKTFKDIKNVKIVKGIIPFTLSEIKSDKIAFLSIDLNNAKPEIETIKYLWDKIVIGGMVLLDDYAYSPRYKVQKEEWDKWANKNNVEILTLATGQGLIIK